MLSPEIFASFFFLSGFNASDFFIFTIVISLWTRGDFHGATSAKLENPASSQCTGAWTRAGT